MIRILHGDCRDVLATLPDASVHCCVTSPPYWGLRSYLPASHPDKHREIGSEPTVEAWVQTIVDVMREVRRVLRKDGTCFINLGDSYAGSRCGGEWPGSTLNGRQTSHSHQAYTANQKNASAAAKRAMTASRRRDDHEIPRSDLRMAGYKSKDLIGQPWMAAFALRADGWWLRQEIIWDKNNPMPESVRDRCTKSHEHIFLLSKSERYFWDFDAVQEAVSGGAKARGPARPTDPDGKQPSGLDMGPGGHREKAGRYAGNGVGFGHGYDETTKPRHNGTAARKARARPENKSMPDDMRNGIRPRGVNPKAALATAMAEDAYADGAGDRMGRGAGWRAARNKQNESFSAAVSTAGLVDVRNPRSVWRFPTQGFKGAHFATFPTELVRRCLLAGCPVGGTVIDPFGGSGTVGLVADRMHRHAILIDLDERNVPMARDRISGDAPLFAEVAA